MGDWPIHRARMPELATAVALTAHATANTKASAWSQFIVAATFDAHGFWVQTTGPDNASFVTFLVDIAIGGAGAESIIVDNLMACQSASEGANLMGASFWPLYIPKGTRMAARCQCNIGGVTCTLKLSLVGGPFPGTRAFGKCTTLGANTAGSNGTTLTAGSYQVISASTTRTFRYINAAFNCPGGMPYAVGRYAAVGAAAAERDFVAYSGAARQKDPGMIIGTPIHVPAGQRLTMKNTSTTETGILYGFS